MKMAGSDVDAKGNAVITREGISRICPAILQQVVSESCVMKKHKVNSTTMVYTQAQSKLSFLIAEYIYRLKKQAVLKLK